MKVQAQRMIGTLVLALATAAVAIGTAQAEGPDDRAGMLGVGAVTAAQGTVAPDWFERAAARALVDDVVLPNDRAGLLGVGAVSNSTQAAAPDWFERGALRATTAVPRGDAPAVDDGFQWGNAAFGAGAVSGLLLLAAAGALTIRHRRPILR